ncbi:MAG: serine/threonine protein kinase [Myxococcales bacterium]|nr:serine/threonine protein kinase [Myxococcales bacterium]
MGAATIFGQRLANRYQVQRELADGSAGAVYLAQDLATRQNVVVKVLVPELSFDSRTLPHLRQRLQRRLKIQPREGSALSHIVDITDVGLMSNDDLYVVLPYLEGDNLSALLQKRGTLSWAQARAVVVTVGRLIAEFHREMLLEGSWAVLGSLQASNCYCLRGVQREASIKLVNSAVDEHIVRRQWRENGEHVTALARYGAPELSTGERIDVRADVYSFGVIVYELVTSRLPFDDTNAARLEAMHLMSPVPAPREVAPDAKIPEALEAVILRALEKRPEDRFPTMSAFVDALQAIPAKRSKELPAIRRGGAGKRRRLTGGKGDTMIMASPYFEEGEGEGEEASAAAEPDDALAGLEAAAEAEAEDEAAAAAAEEAESAPAEAPASAPAPAAAAGELGDEAAAAPSAPPAEVGKPDVIEVGPMAEASAPAMAVRRDDTAPHLVTRNENTQISARPSPRSLDDEAAQSGSGRPPLLVRRSAVSSGESTVRRGGAAAMATPAAPPAPERVRGSEQPTRPLTPVPPQAERVRGADEPTRPLEAIPPEMTATVDDEPPPEPPPPQTPAQETTESGGGGVWLWIVAALAIIAVIIVSSGGFGLFGGGGEAPSAGPPAPTLPPVVSKTATEGARDLVHQARAAEQRGDAAEAYRLASASYEKERTVEALEVMGRAACRLRDVDMARWIFRHLPIASRGPMQSICEEVGLRLDV